MQRHWVFCAIAVVGIAVALHQALQVNLANSQLWHFLEHCEAP